MKVEVLIYAYLAVCVAMIGFNIVCIFLFQRRDNEIEEKRFYYMGIIREQLDLDETTEEHRKYLLKRLSRINGLLSFDKSLEFRCDTILSGIFELSCQFTVYQFIDRIQFSHFI